MGRRAVVAKQDGHPKVAGFREPDKARADIAV